MYMCTKNLQRFTKPSKILHLGNNDGLQNFHSEPRFVLLHQSSKSVNFVHVTLNFTQYMYYNSLFHFLNGIKLHV